MRYGRRQREPSAWTGGIQSTPWFEGSHFPPRTSSGIRHPPMGIQSWPSAANIDQSSPQATNIDPILTVGCEHRSNLDRRLRTLIQSSPLADSETRKSYAERAKAPARLYGKKARSLQNTIKARPKGKERASAACTPRRRSDGASSGTRSSLFAFSSLLFYSSECFLQKLWLLGKICEFFPLKIYFWKVCYGGNWFVFRESFADVLVFSQ